MAKTDKQLQDEINALRKSLNMAELDFTKLNWSAQNLQDELRAMNTLMAQMTDSLSDMVTHIRQLVRGSDNFKNIMNKTLSAVRLIESVTEDLFYHQKGIENLTGKQLWSNAEQIKQKMKMVAFAIKELEQQKNKLKGSKLFTVEQEKQLRNLKALLRDQERLVAVTRLESIKAFIKEYTSLKFIFAEVLKIAKELDKSFGDFAKKANMSYNSTVALSKSLRGLSEQAGVPVRKLLETYAAIGNALRSNAELNAQDLKTFTELREKAGLTNEELAAMQQYTFASGGFLKDNLNTFLRTAKAAGQANGIILNEKQLLQETAKVNKAILAQFTAMPESLGRTVAKAAQLGTNLDGIEGTAKSLLNFEESISAELEAQALTGRLSNLDAARFYSLTNQTEKLTEEIAKHFVSIGEWNEMTRLGQEAYAKSLGKTREEMAQMVFEATSLAGLSEEQASLARQGYDALVKRYGVQRATEMVQEGGVDALIKQQSIQERLTNAVETMKESFVLLVEGPLGTFFEIMTAILRQTTTLKVLMATIAGIMVGRMVVATATMLGNTIKMLPVYARFLQMSISKAVADITSASALTLGVGILAVAAGVATGVALLNSSMDEGVAKGRAFDDVQMGPVGGSGYSRILMGDEGVIGTFNDKDTITAGTNLGGGAREVVAAIRELKQEVRQPTRVMMGSDEVTASVNSNNFRKSFRLGLS